MSAIRALVAATDFSDDGLRAARRAALLSREHSARCQLLHVLREDLLSSLRAHVQQPEQIETPLLTRARQNLDALCAGLEATAGSRPEALVRSGNVLNEILGAADHANVLVLGAHGLRPVFEQLLGTTAERLLRRARRPMVVVRREPATRYARVLVAIDFSLQSLGALNFAQDLAPDAELQLFHAYECPYEGKLRQADIAEDVIQQLRRQFRDEALANMTNVVDKWVRRPASAVSVVEPGNPKLLIPERIERVGIDLVVLGKHGHSPLGDYFLGSVSRHALAKAACDVAIVPDWPRL
jgi:nucleotide-binding universal stress UspA family protein